MRNLFLFLFTSLLLYGRFPSYVPTTTIKNYDANISINASGEFDITETLEIIPRKVHQNIGIDNPLIHLNIPTMIKSKNSIRYVDSEPYDFSLLLNGMPVVWGKDIFYDNSSNKLIRIGFGTGYMTELLSENELKRINEEPKKYIYTLKYKVKHTVIEDAIQDLEKIRWPVVDVSNYMSIKHMNINIFFPALLTKEDIKSIDIYL